MGLEIQAEEDEHDPKKIKVTIKDTEGVEIRPYGASNGTNSIQNGCGAEGISDLLPFSEMFQVSGNSYFKPMLTAYVSAGYQNGLTLQALPYDWRKGYQQHDLDTLFPLIVEKMQYIVSKKVTIIAHSMGNYQVLNMLWKKDQAWRDDKVARYIAIAPPFIGATRAFAHPLGMDNKLEANVKLTKVGMTAQVFGKTVGIYPSDFQLQPRRFFRIHRDKKWMKDMLNRVKKERSRGSLEYENIMDIFPSYSLVECVKYFKFRQNGCFTGLSEMWDMGKLENFEINPDTAEQLFEAFSYNPKAEIMRRWAYDQRFEEQINPGVQTTIIYTNLLPTDSKIFYNDNPKSQTLMDEFYMPDVTEFELGDSTVLTTSMVAPGIKWAYEFNQKEVPGAKPINFAELCGIYKPRKSVFEPSSSEKQVTDNAYFGISCDCMGDEKIGPKDGSECDHQRMVVQPSVIEFVVNSAMDGTIGTVGEKFQKMTAEALENFVSKCELFSSREPFF